MKYLGGMGARRQPEDPLPLLFRPHNPTRNAAVPARPKIPMITKTLPPFFRVKVFVIMKNAFLFG